MMKSILICPEGFEDVSALEIKEIIGAKENRIKREKTVVVFDAKSYEELCKIAYMSQSSKQTILLLKESNFEKEQDLKQIKIKIKKISLDNWIDKKTSFRVKAKVINNNSLSTAELEREFGEAVIENIKEKQGFKPGVNLDNPDVIFYAHVYEDKLYFGIDFTGFNASKRKYKLFSHAASLNGAIAYGLVRTTGYCGKGKLLDCFSGSGMIAIEAGLFSAGVSPNYFDKKKLAFTKLKPLHAINFEKLFESIDKKAKKEKTGKAEKSNKELYGYDSNFWALKSGTKNAKIAGINKHISFSKVDIEWLDTKFKQGEINFIVTHPPQISKRSNRKDVEKLYNEFFHQTEYILADDGRIVFAVSSKESTEALKKFANEKKFELVEERAVWQGKEKLTVLIFLKRR